MSVMKFVRRFLVPRLFTTAYYGIRYGARISTRSEVEFSRHLRMGRKCVVSSFTKIKATNGPVHMGSRCGFATGCFISPGTAGIHLGDGVICGPNVVILGSNYVYDQLDVHLEDLGSSSRGVRIGNNVWIGANSTILDGTVLGDNTIVVANSLVNRRFRQNSILQGNPAKVIMKRGQSEQE